MKNKFFKIIISVLVLTSLSSHVMAEAISQENLIKKAIINNRNEMPQAFKERYNFFKDLIAINGSYEDISSGWLFINDNNNKLIIGSSEAVFCGATMKNDLLLHYGYDLIGYGGIFDEDLIDLMKLIKNKKYNDIVIFGGVNDLNIRAIYKCKDVDLYYCDTLIKLYLEAKEHLKDDNSYVHYIKIKPMTYGRDFDDKDFVDRFNNMAEEVNDNIELFGYKSYEIPFPTTIEYTEHYVHYNNKEVYETMFNDIG